MELAKFEKQKEKFEIAVKEAENISLVQNAGAAFKAVIIVNNLREALTDEIMKEVFMPLMNTKIGFLTDRDPKRKDKSGKSPVPYDIETVRDAIIDAASFGLLPTFNQFNIIAGKMYPTKEGYTGNLKRLGVKYIISFGPDLAKPDAKFSEISYKINYEFRGEQKVLTGMAVTPKTSYSSYDQQKGKSERRAKKDLYEYLTGLDLGEDDGDFTPAEDVTGKVIDQKENDEPKQVQI